MPSENSVTRGASHSHSRPSSNPPATDAATTTADCRNSVAVLGAPPDAGGTGSGAGQAESCGGGWCGGVRGAVTTPSCQVRL
ncbi:hypothetical protein RGF97_25725 [Streptomyces roseicoloratus]|uniref:Uncharacterized protein n=1 Tax=Streptomyces roseicoloratus TaxID=2508722 RepID=A0ABY9S402_9ACTN|nr:hypothetical protein [Streptomyces roseicoloratus]WMX49152.1 hypothetical protein RGF97_25725 [Streptomyces roseicoloratus]